MLLLDPLTPNTCPGCEHEFSLADGFARHSLEALERASSNELAKLQGEARAGEERRARERAARGEALLREQLKDLQELLEAQRRQHADALEQMRALEREGAARREADLRASLDFAREHLGARSAAQES